MEEQIFSRLPDLDKFLVKLYEVLKREKANIADFMTVANEAKIISGEGFEQQNKVAGIVSSLEERGFVTSPAMRSVSLTRAGITRVLQLEDDFRER